MPTANNEPNLSWILRCAETAVADFLQSFDEHWARCGHEPQTREQVDTQISYVEDFKHAIAKALGSKEVELRRSRNAAAPIHRLPAELFVHILLLTLVKKSSWSAKDLHTLAQVSSVWARAVKSSSVFWQHLSSADSDDMRNHVIKVNRSGPLHVVCSSESDDCNESTIRLAIPHTPRWQSVVFGTTVPDHFLHSLSAPTPNLTDLYIYNHDPIEDAPSPKIVLGEGRHLLTIDLEGASLFWDTDRLTGLGAISLRSLQGNLPSVPQFHAMLSSSPHLWCLILQHLHPDPDTKPVSKPRHFHTITLPKLSKLQLSDIPSEINDVVLSTVNTSQPMRLDVDCISVSSDNSLLSCALPYILPAAKMVKLEFDPKEGSLLIQTLPHPRLPEDWVYRLDDKPGCSVSVSWKSGWQRLRACFARIELPPIKLDIALATSRVSLMNNKFPTELLSVLPSLVSLETGSSYDPSPVFKSLLERKGPEWICPRLTELIVRGQEHKAYKDDMVAFVNRSTRANESQPPARVIKVYASATVVAALRGTDAGQDLICHAFN